MAEQTTFLDTMLLSNPERLRELCGRETLVVCGAPRGMTSLIAYTLYELGYFMGYEL